MCELFCTLFSDVNGGFEGTRMNEMWGIDLKRFAAPKHTLLSKSFHDVLQLHVIRDGANAKRDGEIR